MAVEINKELLQKLERSLICVEDNIRTTKSRLEFYKNNDKFSQPVVTDEVLEQMFMGSEHIREALLELDSIIGNRVYKIVNYGEIQ